MKLVMATPGLQPSAIGRMAAMVTIALMRAGHSVDIVRSESADLQEEPSHDFGTRVLSWMQEAEVERLMIDADAVVYHVGDHLPYHTGVLHWMPRHPGVVCLHDFFVGHLFAGWAESRPEHALNILRSWYGDTVANAHFDHVRFGDFIARTHETAPMTEWIGSQARAIITHSTWGLSRVLTSCPGPVRVVPLPYAAPPQPVACSEHAVDDEFHILTVGHVNANKRAESVIRALAASEQLRASAIYTLAGDVTDSTATALNGLAQKLGVRLHILGKVDTETLGGRLRRADVVCCLRWPTLEAASASTIEALLSAKAVIVMNVGFYADLPDACVRKIEPANELEELRITLEHLAANRELRVTLGERAAAWAKQTFTAENYASQLVDVAETCRRVIPVLDCLGRLANRLKQWGGMADYLGTEETLGPLRIFAANPAPHTPTESPPTESPQECR